MRWFLVFCATLSACAQTPERVSSHQVTSASIESAADVAPAICPSFASWDRTGSQLLSSQALLGQHSATVLLFFASWCDKCGPQLMELAQAFGSEGQAGLVVVLSGERYGKAKSKLDAIEAQLGRRLTVVEDGTHEVSRLFGVCEESQGETACTLPATRVCGRDARQLLALHGAQEGLVQQIRAVLPRRASP